jgi:seryl-tRNA synthetase
LHDKTLLEEQIFKSSVHVPERLVQNAEKADTFAKIQSLRNKNKKLRTELEKLNKTIEEYKKQIEDSGKNIEKIKNENKMFLQTQIKDTKTISRLKKEKDDLSAEKEKLKEKIEQLQRLLDNSNNINQSQILNNNQIRPNTSQVMAPKRNQSAVKKKPELEKKEREDSSHSKIKKEPTVDLVDTKRVVTQSSLNNSITLEKQEDILKKLVYYCLKKNINMLRHLQRYDLTKLGKISKNDFIKAIEELKLGLIKSDISRLIENANLTQDYVEIHQFIDIMIEKDKNYEQLIKENGK